MELSPVRVARPLAGLILAAAVVVGGCGDGERPRALESGAGGAAGGGGTGGTDPCARPNTGCACPDEGLTLDCGQLVEEHGDYVTCQMGTRSCVDGEWSECTGDRITVKSVARGSDGGLQPLATLGDPEECPDDDPDTPEDESIDPCDPYCHHVTDEPGDIMPDPGPGFDDDPSGLTLVETGMGNCTSLTLTPSETTLTVTAFSPVAVTPTDTVTFTLTADPPGCAEEPFETTWALDELDRATITGTDNTDGQMELVVPIAGPVQVTAYALGLSASVDINVKVNVWEVPTSSSEAAPNEEIDADDAAEFGTWDVPSPGSEPSQAFFLYPYEDTYFPLGLPPPAVQYWYQTDGDGDPSEVRLSLRWPVDSSSDPSDPNYSDFNYSLLVEESNAASRDAGEPYNIIDPQVVIPDEAWDYFEQSARGDDADIVIQRRRSVPGPDPIDTELHRRVHFVDGQLKGTVYYNSYSSPQGGNTGAILSIEPGATSPTLAVQPGGDCTVCHTVNVDGTALITNTLSGPSSAFNESRRYDITSAGPSPTVLDTYDGSDWPVVTRSGNGPEVRIVGTFPEDATGTITIGSNGWRGDSWFAWSYGGESGWGWTGWGVPLGSTGLTANFYWGYYYDGTTYTWTGVEGTTTGEYWAMTPGDRFTFGAPYGDGSLYMTHGGRVVGEVGVGDPNFRAPNDYSNLFDVSDANNPIAVAGWPSNMLAVTPSFSPDGSLLAFGYWGGDDLPASSGSLSSDASGTRLAVVDFSCSSPPCDSSSTGWTAENARDLTPGVTERVGWPSVLPSGDGVVYQRQYRTSKAQSEDPEGVIGSPGWGSLWPGWSPSHINSSAGALAEIWLSNVPPDGSSAATPTRLLALNGLDSGGVSYLPEDIRPVSPVSTPYHRNSGTDFWITQADHCGNDGYATDNYDYRLNYLPSVNPTEAGGYSWVVFTSRRMYGNVAIDDPWDAKSTMWCSSGTPPTKKLWVSAIDPNVAPGTDPSYPAFYLPGQELMAGNSNGYWVNSPCTPLNGSCTTDDDCCGGTGSTPTTQCKVVDSSVVPPSRECRDITDCSAAGEECTTDDDCCTGLFCPAGGGACLMEPDPVFETQVFEREYIAECPDASHVEWRFFEWQADTPDGTSIEFSVQTKEAAGDSYEPSTPLFLSVADDPSAEPPPTWYRGPDTVDEVLWSATPPQRSKTYLKVTMTFNPDSTGNVAPTLYAWRQIYDCIPNE